jgi:fission process protein 1
MRAVTLASARAAAKHAPTSFSPSSASSRCRVFSSSSTSTSSSRRRSASVLLQKKHLDRESPASFRFRSNNNNNNNNNNNLTKRLSRNHLNTTAVVRAVTKEKEEVNNTAAPEEAASASASKKNEKSETKEYDIYRDSPLRYMGYANECGEAFAAWLPPFGVPATYGVAAVYVLADTFDKAIKANKEKGVKEGVIVGLDTVTWQMLASVFWPGSFIRVTVNATNLLVSKLPADLSLDIGGLDAATIEKALPTAIGLMTIPFIVKPIDKTIDWAMEESVTKVLRGKCESPADYVKAAGILGACLAVPPTLFSFAGVIGDLAA